MPIRQPDYQPTSTDMISLEFPDQVRVSPDGRRVAYTVRTTNWNENRYERRCYVHDTSAHRTYQITRSGDVSQIEWIDDDSLAVARTEGENKAQIWVFEHLVGEGLRVTDHEDGVQSFQPFARGLLFLADDHERGEKKARAERFGSFTHFEQEQSASALYYVGLEHFRAYQQALKKRTPEEAKKLTKPVLELSKRLPEPLKIASMVVSPSNDAIFLNCRSKDDLVYLDKTSHFRLGLDPDQALEAYLAQERSEKKNGAEPPDQGAPENAEDLSYLGAFTRLALPEGATILAVSPEGTKLLVSHSARDNKFYTQPDLWILDLAETEALLANENLVEHMRNITTKLDETVLVARWVKDGIFTGYVSGTRSEIAWLTETGKVQALDFRGDASQMAPSWDFHVSDAGVLGFVCESETSFPEVCTAAPSGDEPGWTITAITALGEQVAGWDLGTVETIRWTSRDGTEIEGVLRKPSDFDPNQKYPLALVVHGGPTWYSASVLLSLPEDVAYYPSVQINHRGILVLKPNYRGSIGRGQAFLELNKDNLGVGDLEDLESAIEHLDAQGFIDSSRVGCMGWSQGGYISAFATIHSERFRATSVGAGIADWYTYHITNDVPQFTTHYLSGTPFKNSEAYVRTAPMSKIHAAKTPTLIQHGAKDQRVPLANATELYRGLQDMGVPVELFVFPEMAHPITKPRENRAVMWQNLTWFGHHLLGDELDFFKVDHV
jgi:dipeptidyl aminopeptidase/acylaminoacyl peptidase